MFLSGYLIPGLVPALPRTPAWGEIGSRVRGTCIHFNPEKGFGFLRYMIGVDNLTTLDTREPGCPYREAFFHHSQCPPTMDLNLLPNRDMIFEFTLQPGREDAKLEAVDLNLVISYASHGSR